MLRKMLPFTLLLPLALLLAGGCTDQCDDTPFSGAPDATFGYVGSETCAGCHNETDRAGERGSDAYTNWAQSGHPYKVTRVDGEAPVDAFPEHAAFANDVIDPPGDYTWDDVSWVIGGFGWKMRWIDNDGWIVTSGAAGDLVQYNFDEDHGGWVTYHTDNEPQTKPYNCGRCHTTGWIDSDDDKAANNLDQLEGMVGWFFAGGIHCEACHGPGGLHADNPTANPMVTDYSSELCGQCHMRDSQHRIASGGGFVKHHEQYDEWLHSPHQLAGVGCNDCHDPHASVIYDEVTPGEGVKYRDEAGGGVDDNCKHCHTEIAYVNHMSLAGCVDCHMPLAAKSATKAHDYQGDVSSHIWSLNTAPVGKTEGMFVEAGNFVILDEEGQAMITLDFACYGCHRDEAGVGGGASIKTLQELSDRATGIHTPPPFAMGQ